jgi:hypothetical protein
MAPFARVGNGQRVNAVTERVPVSGNDAIEIEAKSDAEVVLGSARNVEIRSRLRSEGRL